MFYNPTYQQTVKRAKELHQLTQHLIRTSLVLRAGMRAGEIIKHCSCGRCYGLQDWLSLPWVGWQDFGEIGGELRNCPCHSTLFLVTYSSQPQHQTIPKRAIKAASGRV